MTLNRSQLRTKIREILREFYDNDTVATGGITDSSATLPVDNVLRYSIGDLLIIESELLKVTAIDVDNNQITVIRGIFESTAAAHVAAKAIKIDPEFTDRAVNQAIDFAIGDTFDGQGGIWIETIDETLTTSIASGVSGREYTIPSGLTYIARIQVEDDNGHFQENRDWALIGTKIQFRKDFSASGKTIRLIGTSFQALLTDDSTNLTIADEQAQFVIYDAAFYSLQQRFAHRLKATEFSASVNDRAGQPIELVNMVNTIRRTVGDLRHREFKPRMAEFATRSVR